MTQPPIIYDYGEIGRRLRDLESKAKSLSLPPGFVILVESDIAALPKGPQLGDVVFVLHLGNTRAIMTLAHMRAPADFAKRAFHELMECLKPEYQSLRWVGMEFHLSLDEGKRLVQQVRSMRS